MKNTTWILVIKNYNNEHQYDITDVEHIWLNQG